MIGPDGRTSCGRSCSPIQENDASVGRRAAVIRVGRLAEERGDIVQLLAVDVIGPAANSTASSNEELQLRQPQLVSSTGRTAPVAKRRTGTPAAPRSCKERRGSCVESCAAPSNTRASIPADVHVLEFFHRHGEDKMVVAFLSFREQ